MNAELIWGIVGTVSTIAIAIVGGYWALGRMVLTQFDRRLDERFAAQDVAREEGRRMWEKRFSGFEAEQRRLEREVLELRADLPVNYVRREDHIRFETVIHAKLDGINSRLDLIAERQKAGGG